MMLGGAPSFGSDDFDMYALVSILREARLMVSSRFHGIVTAMPALVPSAGITMATALATTVNDSTPKSSQEAPGEPRPARPCINAARMATVRMPLPL